MSETPEQNIPIALEQTEGAPAGASFFKDSGEQDAPLSGPPCANCSEPLQPGTDVIFVDNKAAHKECPRDAVPSVQPKAPETPVDVPIGQTD